MTLNSEIKSKIIDNVVEVCKEEADKDSNKELLGLTVNYFYDGEVIDIGCVVHIFDNDKDEGYTKNVSFILNDDEIDSDLLILLNQYDKNIKYDKVEEAANEIKEYLETIDWKTKVKIYEDMFVDLELYD